MRKKPVAELRLRVRPVPKPLYGQNLRALLGKYQWTKIRTGLLASHPLVCDTCGKVVSQSKELSAHEEWSYDTAKKPAIARIERIVFDCWNCHACEHFFHTAIMLKEGTITEEVFNDAISHFLKVNGVSKKFFEKHVDEAFRKWDQLSKLEWRADYGPYAATVKDILDDKEARQKSHAGGRPWHVKQ